MTAIVLYESMFGNTRQIAQAIGDGLSDFTDVRVEPASAGPDLAVDLVVIGAPTHAHTLPQASSREEAAKWAADPEQHLDLEPDASKSGVREWIESLSTAPAGWVAFGTRVDIPRIFAGDASAGIERRIRRLHSRPVADSECFLVTTKNVLVDGELDRAREWGRSLGQAVIKRQTT
ncbi:flavodoxin-like protein [Promicromonospora sp. AC04]|uniref:flavodoxin family protein n=1 Tax=Promicromonospora sp. AC04 TaxID=2135723 RepID=UPI000D366CE5|nr:flavodoxin domain-containing protein [Promicromonospora sp. AC04]PUB23445.1 flavodoxin-like protein [Promicromonospora sp. AC04]